MTDSYLLLILLAVPFIGAAVCALLPARAVHTPGSAASKASSGLPVMVMTSTLFAVATFVLALTLFAKLPGSTEATNELGQPTISRLSPISWGSDATANAFSVAGINFNFLIGADSVSIWLVLLSTLLTPIALLASVRSIGERSKEFCAWMLLLLGALVGVFVARDALLFYVFFEITLIPAVFLIGIWGGPARREAMGKFFLYTFAGSVFLLIGILYIGIKAQTFEFERFIAAAQALRGSEKLWVCGALLIGFLVKTPVFPLHTWQALTYSEAPTSATVMFAAVLSKLGTYGLLRLTIPAGFVSARTGVDGVQLLNVVAILAIIGILYGALVAWVQRDFFKLLAFSSLSHLGFCVLGLLSFTTIGVQGAILFMVNHGISTAALFLCLGMVQERLKTREIDRMSGLFKAMPVLSVFFVLFVMSSIGLPGTNGFVSEFLTLQGTFISQQLGMGYAIAAAAGVILSAIYMLHLVAKVFFGPLVLPEGTTARDLCGREISLLAPLAVLVLVLGVQPGLVLNSVREESGYAQHPVYDPIKRERTAEDFAARLGGLVPTERGR